MSLKISQKHSFFIKYKYSRNAMYMHYFLKEEVNYMRCIRSFLTWYKMCYFEELIDLNKDKFLTDEPKIKFMVTVMSP